MKTNIHLIESAIRQIIRTLSSSTSTPIGRSLFSRFLVSSKYIHSLHCMNDAEQFNQLQKLITSQHYSKTHIAGSSVSQPVYYGGHTDLILLINVFMVEKDVQRT